MDIHLNVLDDPCQSRVMNRRTQQYLNSFFEQNTWKEPRNMKFICRKFKQAFIPVEVRQSLKLNVWTILKFV